jgi:hypothetical protein
MVSGGGGGATGVNLGLNSNPFNGKNDLLITSFPGFPVY